LADMARIKHLKKDYIQQKLHHKLKVFIEGRKL